MKLYFMPGACSLAPHIALREARLPFSLVAVDYRTRQTTGGDDFHRINPKGYVPTLVLDSGEVLTEVPVILQFVDSEMPEAALLPASGLKRLRSLEWLNFIATEIHKSFSPLFRPETPTSFSAPGRLHLCRRLSVVEDHLCQQEYLMGGDFSLADVYLFVLCRWLKDQDTALADWPSLHRHSEIIGKRPSVQQAMGREGLL
ncbi:glutathione transferase GstA [Sedimentitalea sp. HM32M-2]|uniref:glutathione transferase GstA n=1 Tax=Sedimentitalea sp. HM32M-2 TaxID=3351566 RepID=UPI00363ECC85